jgi:hypothetical protein
MKTYQEFITEIKTYAVPAGTKEWKLATAGYVPLTPAILQHSEIDIITYHTTDISRVKDVEKYQGKRKDLATFRVGSESLSRGIYTRGEILLTLKGKTSFAAAVDASTILDRSGIRWLSAFWKSKKLLTLFTAKMLDKILEHYGDEIPKGDPKYGINYWNQIREMVSGMDGRGKAAFMKFYMEESKKLITPELLSVLISEIEELNREKSYKQYDHDEVLLHNYIIIDKRIIISKDQDKNKLVLDKAKAENIDITSYGTINQEDLITLGRK